MPAAEVTQSDGGKDASHGSLTVARDHPGFVPLAGFFTGMIYIIVLAASLRT